MEAKALFPFDATHEDELSFREGDILKVRNKEGEGWFQAELKGKLGYVPSTYIQMEPHDWYRGNISRVEAESHLTSTTGGRHYHDGYFLIRDCQTDRNQFSLSVLHGRHPQHFKILSNPNGTYYLWPDKTFPSINKLIDYHRNVSIAREPNTKIFLRDTSAQEENIFEALYSFKPESCDELQFKKGDKIKIIDNSDPNWWMGEDLNTCQRGLLPSNYIKKLS